MGLTSIIKYEGDNQTFVWKHPQEDFNTGSQLIVHESQEAILFLNGEALDSFGPGRHELTTQNIPLLSKLANLPTGGFSPFHAEIYFINLVEQLGIPWGTNSKVQFLEPQFHFPLSIGASGEMGLAVKEPRKLLLKIVGTEAVLSQSRFLASIKSFLQMRIKTALAQSIVDESLSVFDLDAHLDHLSELLQDRLIPDIAQYGVALTQMSITTITKPDGDPLYEQFKQLYFRQYADIQEALINQQVDVINQQTEAQKTVIEAEAVSKKREIEGYTYQQERGFDVASLMAQNEASGEFANIGIGLGLMAGIGTPMGSTVGNAVSQAIGNAVIGGASNSPAQQAVSTAASEKYCSNCGYRFVGTEKFCPECGTRRR